MRFRIPGKDLHVRIMEPVKTEDPQYNVYDTGVEYGCGGIDSVVTGVSAHSFKKWAEKQDEASLKKRTDEEKATASTTEEVTETVTA